MKTKKEYKMNYYLRINGKVAKTGRYMKKNKDGENED
jgi:hypothetical protein